MSFWTGKFEALSRAQAGHEDYMGSAMVGFNDCLLGVM